MKKTLSVLLCLIMVLSIFTIVPFDVFAAEISRVATGESSGTTGDCTWTLDDEGVLTISGNGAMEDYVDYNSSPWHGHRVTSVIIEDGVTNIGDCAFSYCTDITSVTIPDSVTIIGTRSFYYCSRLGGVSIPNYVTSIGDLAFSNCSSIGGSVTFPASIVYIGGEAFRSCGNLYNITFPNTYMHIGRGAFYNSGWLSVQPTGLVYAGKILYSAKNYNPYTTSIKEGTLGISPYAFNNCNSLKNITIPKSVISIGSSAFYLCTNLQWINIKNPECTIEESYHNEYFVPKTTHICCAKESLVATYAQLHGNGYGHSGGWNTVTSADCTSAGLKRRTCTYCSDIEEEEIPALGHTYGIAPVWTWSGDNTSATATFTCITSGCGHEETVNADITNIVENGKIKRTATAEIDGTTYTDTIIIDSPLDAAFDSAIMAGDVAAVDGNRFNLPTNLEYKKASLLGVQKKETIQTTSGGTGLRFIAELSSEYVGKDNIDYGFEVVKTSRESTKAFDENGGFNTMQQLIDSGSDNIMSVSCKDTQNNVANPEYGDNDSDSTAYKYVTLSIKNIAYSQGVAVRFYVEIDGVRNYSSYQNSDGTFIGCCTSYNTIANLDA